MDHSYSDIRSKIIFFQPSDRQNFANALGQTCILDLRLRLNYNFIFELTLLSSFFMVTLWRQTSTDREVVAVSTDHGYPGTSTACQAGVWVKIPKVNRNAA